MKLDRRSFMYGATAVMAANSSLAATPAAMPDTSALKRAGHHSGKVLGMYTVAHEVLTDPAASAIIANTFSLIADGNDLKFADRLRPTPTTYNFAPGDAVVTWTKQHDLLFRGHCLVWWNALPKWFASYVTPANAKQVLTDHITTVVKHFEGSVYGWDVVNEAIYHDGRPDGLRKKPWLDFLGPEYIDLAFRTAHAADPKARLVLNECYVEHNTPAEIARRGQLLALATRLKKSGVPITTLGLQSHLRGNTPLDKPGIITFLKQVKDLDLEIWVTELDVDDVDVPAPLIDQTVASKYEEYLGLVGPYVRVITFEQLKNDDTLPKRPDGMMHRPNLLDDGYKPVTAYGAVVKALNSLPAS